MIMVLIDWMYWDAQLL